MNQFNHIISYVSGAKTQEKVLSYLRDLDFELMPYDKFIEVMKEPDNESLITKFTNWAFMMRKLGRTAYDPRIFFIFKMYGKKINKFYYSSMVQGFHISIKKVKVPWKDAEDINWRKMKVTLAFPMCLDYVERRTWRTEYLRHRKFPGKYPESLFYKIFYHHIMKLSSNLVANKGVK